MVLPVSDDNIGNEKRYWSIQAPKQSITHSQEYLMVISSYIPRGCLGFRTSDKGKGGLDIAMELNSSL